MKGLLTERIGVTSADADCATSATGFAIAVVAEVTGVAGFAAEETALGVVTGAAGEGALTELILAAGSPSFCADAVMAVLTAKSKRLLAMSGLVYDFRYTAVVHTVSTIGIPHHDPTEG